jgi:hypothetical protein
MNDVIYALSITCLTFTKFVNVIYFDRRMFHVISEISKLIGVGRK